MLAGFAFGAPDFAATEIYGQLDPHLAMAESAAAYQRAFNQEPTANTTARIHEIKSLRERYAENRLKAIGESKLPEAKSTDSRRIEIARQILAHPSYGFGEHGPIVLTTADVVEREQQVSRAEIRNVEFSLSGDGSLAVPSRET